ncbi:hypothetical protein ZWY2020_052361 [Hordeum vulgare]|nr:hypothetical protein ZWY2020_052361 [Hordeum vulgare]
MDKFACALRLRWIWLRWTSTNFHISGIGGPCDDKDFAIFARATNVCLGNGKTDLFWKDAWLNGMSPRDIAPSLFAGSSRKGRTVHDALLRDNWIDDLQRNWHDDMMYELINLSNLLDQTNLHTTINNSITWKLTSDGKYSARTAYLLQFEGMIQYNLHTSIWRAWAPPKCKIFLWTAMQRKILTTDILLLRGWDSNYFCPLCMRSLETAAHLLSECPWSRKVWNAIAVSAQTPSLQRASWMDDKPLSDWFHDLTTPDLETQRKKGVRALAMLICWELWLERNRRIFKKTELQVSALITRIRDEAAAWKLAGCPITFDPG